MPQKFHTQLLEAPARQLSMSPFNRPTQSKLRPLPIFWRAEYARIRRQVAMDVVLVDKVVLAVSESLDRERPFRVMNQRHRLFACYWAGWVPDWMSPVRSFIHTPRHERYGTVGPKWLGGRP